MLLVTAAGLRGSGAVRRALVVPLLGPAVTGMLLVAGV